MEASAADFPAVREAFPAAASVEVASVEAASREEAAPLGAAAQAEAFNRFFKNKLTEHFNV